MFVCVSKSARCLAIVSCFSGIGGCASDGGAGELAVVGLVVGAASMDSGALLGAAAAGTGLMLAASMSGDDDAKTGVPPSAPSLADAAPTMTPGVPVASVPANASTTAQGSTVADLMAKETVARYQNRSCDYLHLSLSEADQLIASTIPEAPKVGNAKKSVVTRVFQGKNCPPLSPLPGRIGAAIVTVDPIKAPRLKIPATGVWVEGANPGSNAEKAGLSRGDVVVAINDKPVEDVIDFRLAIGQSAVGSTAKLKVWHGQRFYTAPVLIGQ